MISVAVRLETECGTCRMPMPVNTLAREVGCPSCGRRTEVSDDVWQALLRDPVYDGPRMLANEGRQCSARKLSAAYTRRGPCCQGCEKEIPVASIVEVREQAMLQCDRCAKQTWVRAVPVELAGALPNITHLVGEDPDSPAMAQANAAEAATFPCPQCGSPVAFDGVNRAYTCRFCSANVHVPDDFVYRGRRKVAADWFLIFHPSIADSAPAQQAVAAGLFDWEEPPVAAVDAEGNVYCAAKQSHWYYDENNEVTEKKGNILWSLDSSLKVRWLRRDRSDAARFVCCIEDKLLVIGTASSSPLWLDSKTGTPVESSGAASPARGVEPSGAGPLACDRDGSLLVLKDSRLRRIAANGAEVAVWAKGAPEDHAEEVRHWDWDEPVDRPVEIRGSVDVLHCGPDGSLYMLKELWPDVLVRLDADGRTVYRVELPDQAPGEEHQVLGTDLRGNAYVLRASQLVRVSATGAQSVVLTAERDALPRSKMSIAVCPDGSFWLFGEEGLAWKFEPGGKLLFASEKEPRPRKPTHDDLVQRKANAAAEAYMAQAERARVVAAENFRMAEELVSASIEWKRRVDKIGWVVGALVLVVLVLFLLWLFVGRAQS
ncbi:hypothetical protein WME73_14470 [Sorangium sp. So ce302]|uniref:hypothetical protein n=1 Tax=Sorangium sp. So ce302 TaxID=3133297 RepID=UPI003F61A0AE